MPMLPYAITNTSEIKSSGGLPLIPEGDYRMRILFSEAKKTKSGNGEFFEIKMVIDEGQYKDTEFTERLNVDNPNQQAVEIAFATLARMAEAVGRTNLSSTEELHNIPFIGSVKTEKGKPYIKDGVEKQGNDYSVVKAYKPLPSVGLPNQQQTQSTQPQTQQAAPWARK